MRNLENKRPLLLMMSGALIVVLIAAVAAAFWLRGAGRFRSAPNTPYPYKWTEGSVITLELDSGDAPDGVWTTESENNGTIVVTIGEAENGKTEATLRPVTAGRASVTFTLTEGETRLAEASFTVEAERDERGGLLATVTDHSEDFPWLGVSGGENTGYPFNVQTGAFGNAVIHITDSDIKFESNESAAEIPEETAKEVPAEETEIPAETAEEIPSEIPEESSENYGSLDAEFPWEVNPAPEVEIPEEIIWTAYSSDETVIDVPSVVIADGGTDIYLRNNAVGSADIFVSKKAANLTYIFTFEFNGMNLSLTNTRTDKYRPAPTPVPETEETAEAGGYEETPEANEYAETAVAEEYAETAAVNE